MFPFHCDECTADHCSAFLEHWQHYNENCPLAPYTWYIVLGLFALFFYMMWSRASAKLKAVKAVNNVLSASQPCSYDQRYTLGLLESNQSRALELIRGVQADCLQKLTESHTESLKQIESIVESFNSPEED